MLHNSAKSLYLYAKRLYTQGKYHRVHRFERQAAINNNNYRYIIQSATKQDTPSILETDPEVQEWLQLALSEYITKIGDKERVPSSRIKTRVDEGEMKVNLSPVGDYDYKPDIDRAEAQDVFSTLKAAIIAALVKNTVGSSDSAESDAKPLTKSISSKYINEFNQTRNLLELVTMYETFVARLNPKYQKEYEEKSDKESFLVDFKVPRTAWEALTSEQQAFLLKKYRMYKKGTESQARVKEILTNILMWSRLGRRPTTEAIEP